MSHYYEEVNEFDHDFKSLKKKASLTAEERSSILGQIQEKLDDTPPFRKNYFLAWKSITAYAGLVLIVMLLIPGLFNGLLSYEGSRSGKALTAEQAVEQYYQFLNSKEFEAFYDLQSKNLKKTMAEQTGMTKEEFLKGWKSTNDPPVKINKIEKVKVEGRSGTFVAGTVDIPLTTRGPAYSQVTTFKVVKENDEWKIDEVLSSERVN